MRGGRVVSGAPADSRPPSRAKRRAWASERPRDIACKGQPLLAGSRHPAWAKSMGEDETRQLYADYFRRVAERYGESYQMFDVVNEALYQLFNREWKTIARMRTGGATVDLQLK